MITFTKYWRFKTIFFLFVLLTSCTNLELVCCQECLAQSQQDPSGYDISIKECSQYQVSEECQEFFAEKSIRVGQC